MTKKEMQNKLITCILPKGKALPVVHALKEKGITRMNFAFARGSDIGAAEWKKGLPREVEKEILTVVAKDEEQGEELFDLIYEKADLGNVGGGFMYMTKLAYAVPYILPEIDEDGQKTRAVSSHEPAAAASSDEDPERPRPSAPPA